MSLRRCLLAAVSVSPLALGVVVLTATPAAAAEITVTTQDAEVNVDGDCSLAEAVIAANTDAASDACAPGSGADVIRIPDGTYAPGAALGVTDADGLDIIGTSASGTILTGSDLHRIFEVVAGDFTIESASLVHGEAGAGITDSGGAILSSVDGGLVTIVDAIVSDNHGSHGGAVRSDAGDVSITASTFERNLARYNDLNGNGGAVNTGGGDVTVNRSTFRDNTAVNAGGAVLASDDLTISNSTFEGNTGQFGGAVYGDFGALEVVNSTFDANSSTTDSLSYGGTIETSGFATASLTHVTVTGSTAGHGVVLQANASVSNSIIAGSAGGDCAAFNPITSGGGNVTSDETCNFGQDTDQLVTDPELGPLGANGGPTRTRLPLTGSAAIDAGVADACRDSDQRGVSRPADGDGDGSASCDSGAVEVAALDPDGPGPLVPGDPLTPPAVTPVVANPRYTG